MMNNTIFENLNEVGKTSYESIKELYAINTNIARQLVEQQLALVNLGVDCANRQLKLAGEASGYKEVINGQSEIASDVSSKTLGIARNTVDILTESKEEVNTWFENGMKEAAKVTPFIKAA
jgi:phasin family protein